MSKSIKTGFLTWHKNESVWTTFMPVLNTHINLKFENNIWKAYALDTIRSEYESEGLWNEYWCSIGGENIEIVMLEFEMKFCSDLIFWIGEKRPKEYYERALQLINKE